MALCYPLELARLRVMLDFNEPPENVTTKLFTQMRDLVKESPNAWKEAFHGVAPYLAHHTMFGLAMLWPYTLFNASLMPAMLGYLSTGVLAYPVSTLHTRVAYEAGLATKKYGSAFECFEHIMDHEKPARLYNGLMTYYLRNIPMAMILTIFAWY